MASLRMIRGIVSLLICVLGAKAPLHSQVTASPSDSLLLEIATTLVRGMPHTHAVWPDGWFEGDFAVIVEDGRTLVVLSDGSTEPVNPILSRESIDGFYRTAYLLPAGHPEAPDRNGRSSVADRNFTLVWPFNESVFGVDDPLLANVVVMYHEFFHSYQLGRRMWSVLGWDNDPPREVIVSEPFQALARRERALLARALLMSSSDSLTLLLSEYLQLRADRMEMLPPGTQGYENDYERLEGMAQYVGYAAGLAAVRGSAGELPDIVRADLLNTPPFDQPLWRSGPYRDWHVYATGSAIAILLGRLDPSGSWREPLARNSTFPELLQDALRDTEPGDQ